MKSHANDGFCKLFDALPTDVQEKARQTYTLFRENPFDPRLQFKELGGSGGIWSVRIGLRWRALGRRVGNDIYWYWIGSHSGYDNRTR
jgi:hypothetical protein